MKYIFFIILAPFFLNNVVAQNAQYTTANISDLLKENANSIIREQSILVKIKSVSSMVIKKTKVVTVLNKEGLKNIDATEDYNKTKSVNNIEAIVYNGFGNEIKKIKKKDFEDISIANDASNISDTRLLVLKYTPTEYPFTIVYNSEIETSNTAFIPSWYIVDDYYESIQKSTYEINYPEDLGFKYKKIDADSVKIDKGKNSYKYVAENLPAIKIEDLATKKFPHILFGFDKFQLEGVLGTAKSWKEFGIWVNEKLLKGTNALSDETVEKIKKVVGLETDPVKKAKIVYQYVQDKTRYVSIQLGIGGWKPMNAMDVDRLGYGDCKALSNYTKSLLEAVNVPSFYTIIFGDEIKKDIQEDFVSMQGNHVVLAIPVNNKLTFLECTSQTKAFGFEGDFTDDRLALVIKPEGGELVKTKEYSNKDNSQYTFAKVTINEEGNIMIKGEVVSKGIQCDDKVIYDKAPRIEVEKYYKSRFWNLNNLLIENFKFENNKEQIEIKEVLTLRSADLFKSNSNEWLIPVNFLNQSSYIPQRYRNRKSDFEIARGYYDEDLLEIEIPSSMLVVNAPSEINLTSPFGEYKGKVEVLKNKIIYKRSLLINKGVYPKAEYDKYRNFREQIAKNDNLKVIVKK